MALKNEEAELLVGSSVNCRHLGDAYEDLVNQILCAIKLVME